MNLLEDPNVKSRYQKYKYKIKKWENDFMEKYARPPKKNDIHKADASVRDAYKKYWNLKIQALDETLLDITFEDEVQANVAVNISTADASRLEEEPRDINASIQETSDKLLKNVENISPKKSPVKEIPAAVDGVIGAKNVVGVWGDHLNKDAEVPKNKNTRLVGRSSSMFQLSQKKFNSASFSKRNPRKSLSLNKTKSKTSVDAGSTSTLETKVDKNEEDFVKSVFSDRVKIVEGEKKNLGQSVNTISRLMNNEKSLSLDRKFDAGWLERCARENNLEPIVPSGKRHSGTSDSGIDVMDSSVSPPAFNHSTSGSKIDSQNLKKDEDDDDEFVCNSDSEDEHRKKRSRNWRKSFPDNQAKRFCPENRVPVESTGSTQEKVEINRDKNEIIEKIDKIVEDKTKKLEEKVVVESEDKDVSPPAFNHSISGSKTDSKNLKNDDDDDDDEFVCNSDSEEERRKKRSKNWRKNLPDNQAKRFCPENRVPDESTGSTQEKVEINKDKNEIIEKIDKIVEDKTKKLDEKIVVESEDEEKPRKKKPTIRAVRKKPLATARKTLETIKAARKQPTRSTRRKKVSYDNDDPEEEKEEVDEPENIKKTGQPEIPIYGIESFDVVPRFAVPQETNGDLVSEFSKTVGQTDKLPSVKVAAKKMSAMSDREKLEAKIAAGKINENFVRINLKKKIYSRGKKSFNFSRYKKGQWKQRKKDLASSESALDLADLAEKNTCFKCGGTGHISRSCPSMKSDELLPLTEDDPSDFPTLEEAEKMANQAAKTVHSHRPEKLPSCPSMSSQKPPSTTEENKEPPTDEYLGTFEDEDFDFDDEDFDEIPEEDADQPKKVGHKIPDDLLAKLLPPINGAIDPLYSLDQTGQLIKTPKEVLDSLKMFGHKTFRPGQEKAMMRILSGQSTLVTLSTGSGKSLCYQLPAYLYSKRSHCITLVVSPLVSLMDDQVTGVPHFLRAAALHTGQTPKVREKIMETVKKGELDILLVSPEAIVAGEKSSGFGSLLRQLPPIAFACIDEAHCISQWSHNFRPSYLMICRVLIEKMGVKTILGLTATATRSTAKSIVEHLKIPDGLAGVISDIPMPNNLMLTVSKDEQRDRALIELLQSERFKKCDSIIVYCTRREECTRISGLLRISLQGLIDPDKPKPKAKVSQISEAYHAGLASSRRKVIQKAFMKGDTRIVVATVAFGMGINKSDIRSVIHYNMPSSFEGYVQEVGRAGRDNLPAHCHLFLSPIEDSDKWELRRHIYADGVDRHSIRRLLQKIFVPCSCSKEGGRRCPGHEVAISIDETVKALDVTEETIATLLCYLELHPRKLVTVLSSVYITARVSSYAGPKGLKIAAQSSPPLAMAIALDAKKGITHDDDSVIEFPVVDVAAAIGWDSGVVKSHLKNLEWSMVDGKSKRTAISVKYETLGLRVRAPGDLSDTELDEALEALYERTQSQQDSGLKQLEAIHAALNKFSYSSVRDCVRLSDGNLEKSEFLKDIIREYFQSDKPLSVVDVASGKACVDNEAQIVADVRSLICSYRDNNFTGRAVARIFHGIQSPNYSALTWCRCRFWRAHIKTDFNFICQVATREILALR